MFSFMASYLLFKKQKFGERKRYDPWKNSKKKKKKNAQKKGYYSQQQLESHFWPEKRWNLIFSIFWKSGKELNFLSKNTNPESI